MQRGLSRGPEHCGWFYADTVKSCRFLVEFSCAIVGFDMNESVMDTVEE